MIFVYHLPKPWTDGFARVNNSSLLDSTLWIPAHRYWIPDSCVSIKPGFRDYDR